MKLGTQTASLMNHIMANQSAENIVQDIGATVLSWTDRYAATVISTFRKGMYDYVVVQYDDVERLHSNPLSDAQAYEYTRNESGTTMTFRVLSDGFQHVRLNDTGRYVKSGSYGLMLGSRQHFIDPSF